MAAVAREDPDQVRAAQILVSLRDRKLRRCPEWVPKQPLREASSSSPPGTVPAKVMPPSGQAASSSAGTVAARVAVPLRRRPDRVISMQSGEVSSLSLAGTVAAGVPDRWPKAKRSGSRGETSKELPEQGHAAAAAAKGSGAPRSSEQERCAETEMPPAAASAPVVAALCYTTVARSGTGPSTSAAAPANKEEPMKTPSPNTPLDYGAGGSGPPSSAEDAASARPQAKRKGTGDDEGCSSPAKRRPLDQEEKEKPMPISVEPSVQSQTRASSGKGAPRPFDLNLLPCAAHWTTMTDDDGWPDTN